MTLPTDPQNKRSTTPLRWLTQASAAALLFFGGYLGIYLSIYLGFFLGFGSDASARSDFFGVMAQQYRLWEQPSSALARADCRVCHINSNGGPPWNVFGYSVGFWRGQKQDIRAALASALRYGGDSDKDFYPDLLEQLAGSNINERDSKPSEKLAALKARFDAQYSNPSLAPLPDSDRDGYGDALEVFAGTLPGDSNSLPSEGVGPLRERFLAAGGLARYEKR
jgi:hypothetical protein